jgi:hypothetical protein
MGQHKLTMYESAVYRICFQGTFDDSWLQNLGADWIIHYDDESPAITTTITGVMCDQAALMGFLSSLYDVGLPLLGVECLETSAEQSRHDDQQTVESEG